MIRDTERAHPHNAVRMRPKSRAAAAHRVAVFTSVDGTLLDAATFAPGASTAAVQRLHAAGIPVIPVSVMTLEELAPIAATLGMQHAMIIEAGGAIARWNGSGWDVEAFGPPAAEMLEVIREIEYRSGANLLVYSVLPDDEAARISGRSGALLEASRHRSFTEPFVIESGDLDAVRRAAAEIGFSVRQGRRFLHLCREFDEGEAFVRLRDELQCDLAIAIGGAAVDAELLLRADVPILIPGPDGRPDPELRAALPHARIASAPGPEGWAAAAGEVLASLAAPRRRARPA